jgi:GT2 family glycosyltransferase
MRCSIVIGYNEEQHLAGCWRIIQQNIRILRCLVDSGSPMPRQHRRPLSVTILHIQPEEFTFGRSLNLGIQSAQSEYVIIASAHVYPVYPDWIDKLLAPFADPKVALTYGKQRGNQATRFSEQQVFAQWFPDHPQPRQAHPFCNNANAAIRRRLWEQRPYDEALTGLEDLDWARWAMEQGHAITYVPEAEVIHVHNETPVGVHNRYRREAMAFKRIFPEERFNLGDFLRLVSSNVMRPGTPLARVFYGQSEQHLWSAGCNFGAPTRVTVIPALSPTYHFAIPTAPSPANQAGHSTNPV